MGSIIVALALGVLGVSLVAALLLVAGLGVFGAKTVTAVHDGRNRIMRSARRTR